MRILHTADWHLGHTLRDHSRVVEHAAFLRWLVQTIVDREVDALLIAGDVFDAANPPPAAWRMWFEFLGELKRARPQVQVVVIAGNHDSAARLEAPRELLSAFDVRVIGALRRGDDGRLVVQELLVPLGGEAGRPAAWCVAIPFLRASDVMALSVAKDERVDAAVATPGGDDCVLPEAVAVVEARAAADPVLDGMRALHDEVFAAARARRRPGQALVAMAHGYLVGGAISELSERKVLGGNQHALPLDLFPDDCDYVALGHLHRPQQLAGREHVRYSGSPLPLSMPERLHPHHVVFADFAAGALAKVWSLRVPRTVELVRIPDRGELEPEAALAAVAALPPRDNEAEPSSLPFVEVVVRLPQPSPRIGERIAQLIESRAARLVRVEVVLTGSVAAPVGAAARPQDLTSLTPEQLFVRRYAKDHAGPVPETLLDTFRTLLDEVEHGGGP
ncbi:MAG: exonuclease SbcCD subunit D C-terminal domain-containing protein [Planctomycetes bacterium]|nr:exonuclease SbcCD subunit D C-terminal domain-containing protein [Planctomycetota bacterium]